MTKSEIYWSNKGYKILGNKKCEGCDRKFNIYITRDLQRKRFCSRECFGKINSKENNLIPPKPTKATRKKIGETLSHKMAIGLIPKPPIYLADKNTLPNLKISFICDFCHKISSQKIYQYKSCKHHFCNYECFSNYRKLKNPKICAHKETKITFNCENCGKLDKKNPYYYNSEKHHCCGIICSRELRRKFKKLTKFICPNCNKEFFDYASVRTGKNIFCSRRCRGHFIGKLRFKDYKPKTPLRKLIKTCYLYDDWQISIYKKDNYKCCNCNNNRYLHAHHLKPFALIFKEFLAKYPELNPKDNINELLELSYNYNDFWDVNNGQTLCAFCHQKEHPELNLTLTRK